MINNSKPHPEIFISVKNHFNILSSECIVFEDSENGINAAYNANMDCIQIIDLVKPNTNIKNKTIAIYNSFNDIFKDNFIYLKNMT